MNSPKKRKILETAVLLISIFLFIAFIMNFYLFLEELTELSGVSYYIDVVKGIAFTGSKFNILPVVMLLVLPVINIIFGFIWISTLFALMRDPFETIDRRRLGIFLIFLLLNIISHYSFGMAVIGAVDHFITKS